MALNNANFTRKDIIIDLTITKSSFASKFSGLRLNEEVFLQSDHKLITFELGQKKRSRIMGKVGYEGCGLAYIEIKM